MLVGLVLLRAEGRSAPGPPASVAGRCLHIACPLYESVSRFPPLIRAAVVLVRAHPRHPSKSPACECDHIPRYWG